MYAMNADSKVYHIAEKVSVSQRIVTLCGLVVSRVPSVQVLHAVVTAPDEHTLCEHCERIQNAVNTEDLITSLRERLEDSPNLDA
jgi:hypothetical protein